MNEQSSRLTPTTNKTIDIHRIRVEIELTKFKLTTLQLQLNQSITQEQQPQTDQDDEKDILGLGLEEYIRYGRQMILTDIGLSGQLRLKQASVLVIGAGGLGCPALMYLARAGLGNLSIVDHDQVELSNLHRQILHTQSTLGMNKAQSAKINLLEGNPLVNITAYPIPFVLDRIRRTDEHLAKNNGCDDDHPSDYYLPDLTQFSLVLDCTDNPTTRYLISDACVAYGIPLVSGAAIRSEGQLSIWNLPLNHERVESIKKSRGPCYRCVFEETQEVEAQNCSDEGVLGPIVGLVGTLMAWETIKLLTKTHDLKPKLLLIPSFRSIKLRSAKLNCLGCSQAAQTKFKERLSNPSFESNQYSIQNSCKLIKNPSIEIVDPSKRIKVEDFLSGKFNLNHFRLIIDVRPTVQFGICSLKNSINIPFNEIDSNQKTSQIIKIINQTINNQNIEKKEEVEEEEEGIKHKNHDNDNDDLIKKQEEIKILLVCRRGNDSLTILNRLLNVNQSIKKPMSHCKFFDLSGGLDSYSKFVDIHFPTY